MHPFRSAGQLSIMRRQHLWQRLLLRWLPTSVSRTSIPDPSYVNSIVHYVRPVSKITFQCCRKRSPPLPTSLLSWPYAIYNLYYDDIRRQNGLDAYVFVHFLRMMVKILLPIWFFSWVILLPLNSIRHPQGLTGLDQFTFGNISRNNQSRYAVHLVLAYAFTFWILYVLKKEMRHFITIRQ